MIRLIAADQNRRAYRAFINGEPIYRVLAVWALFNGGPGIAKVACLNDQGLTYLGPDGHTASSIIFGLVRVKEIG